MFIFHWNIWDDQFHFILPVKYYFNKQITKIYTIKLINGFVWMLFQSFWEEKMRRNLYLGISLEAIGGGSYS